MGITVQRARDVLIERVTVRGSGIISGELHAVSDVDGSDQDESSLRGSAATGSVVRHRADRRARQSDRDRSRRDPADLRLRVPDRGRPGRDSRYGLHDMYAADVAFRGNDLSGTCRGSS